MIPQFLKEVSLLDQSLECPLSTPSPTHEQVLATTSKQEVQFGDVIERIGRFSIDEDVAPSQRVG